MIQRKVLVFSVVAGASDSVKITRIGKALLRLANVPINFER